MKLKNKYFEKVINKSHMREALRHLHLSVKDKLLTATNGFLAVRVPVELNKSDKEGLIPLEIFKETKKGEEINITCFKGKVKCNGKEIERDTKNVFPVINKVVPLHKNRCDYRVGIDAEYLYNIAKIINNSKSKNNKFHVVLNLSKNNKDSLLVESLEKDNKAYAILMPVGVGE